MKTHLVSFATPQFYQSQRTLNKTALEHGIDEVISYTKEKIVDTPFYAENKDILDQKRGAGYWLWKPYIILETLNNVNDGDVVMYTDAGIDVTGSLVPLFNICEREEILLFHVHNHKNKFWTKRDCFIALDCDYDRYFDSDQVNGAFQLYLCNARSKKFVSGWLEYCQKENLITDRPNVLGEKNLPGFLEHRHDQSLLTLLAIKWDLNTYRDPSQDGVSFIFDSKFTASNYPAVFNHHRTWGPLVPRLIADVRHILCIRKDFTLYQKIVAMLHVVFFRIKRKLVRLS